MRDNLFFFIKNLDESSVNASNFYINVLGYLQDMAQSLEYISKVSLKHINNNHKKLKFSQIKELKEVASSIEGLFNDVNEAFASESFDEIAKVLNDHEPVRALVNQKFNLRYLEPEAMNRVQKTQHFTLVFFLKQKTY